MRLLTSSMGSKT